MTTLPLPIPPPPGGHKEDPGYSPEFFTPEPEENSELSEEENSDNEEDFFQGTYDEMLEYLDNGDDTGDDTGDVTGNDTGDDDEESPEDEPENKSELLDPDTLPVLGEVPSATGEKEEDDSYTEVFNDLRDTLLTIANETETAIKLLDKLKGSSSISMFKKELQGLLEKLS